MAALCDRRVDRAGDGHDLAAGLERLAGGDQRAGLARRLDHQGGQRQAGDQPVAPRKVVALGLGAERQLGEDRAAGGDRVGQRPVARRVDPVDPGAHDRERAGRGLKRALVGCGVDALREAADHGEPRLAQRAGEVASVAQPGLGGVAAAHDRDRRARERCRIAPHEQHRRRVGDLEQAGRIARVVEADQVMVIGLRPVERGRHGFVPGGVAGEQRLGARRADRCGQLAVTGREHVLGQAEGLEQAAHCRRPEALGEDQPQPRRAGVARPGGKGHSDSLVRWTLRIGDDVADRDRLGRVHHQTVGDVIEHAENEKMTDGFVRKS